MKTFNKHPYLFIFIIAIFSYLAIYFFFISDGFIPNGSGLSKKEWLAFLGSFLSLLGTVLITLLLFQQSKNHRNAELEKSRLLQLPYFHSKRVTLDEIKNYPKRFHLQVNTKNEQYLEFNCAPVFLKDGIPSWPVKDSYDIAKSQLRLQDLNLLPIYLLGNFGIGNAYNVKLSINDDEYTVAEAIEKKDVIILNFDQEILKQNLEFTIGITFNDIFGNSYKQVMQCTNEVKERKFLFNIAQLHESPPKLVNKNMTIYQD